MPGLQVGGLITGRAEKWLGSRRSAVVCDHIHPFTPNLPCCQSLTLQLSCLRCSGAAEGLTAFGLGVRGGTELLRAGEWLWLQDHLPPCVPKFSLVPLTTQPCGLASTTSVVIIVIFLGSCVFCGNIYAEMILKSSSGEELLPFFLHTSMSIWALVQLSFRWNGIYLIKALFLSENCKGGFSAASQLRP